MRPPSLRRSVERVGDRAQQQDRLGRPVSSSWPACQARACSLRTRSVMSVWLTTTRRAPLDPGGLQPEPADVLAQPAGVVVVERRRPGSPPRPAAAWCRPRRSIAAWSAGSSPSGMPRGSRPRRRRVRCPSRRSSSPFARPRAVGGEDAAVLVDEHGGRREGLEHGGELGAPPRPAAASLRRRSSTSRKKTARPAWSGKTRISYQRFCGSCEVLERCRGRPSAQHARGTARSSDRAPTRPGSSPGRLARAVRPPSAPAAARPRSSDR